MRRALLPNLTFEYELAGRDIPAAARRQCRRWEYVLRLVPGFRDASALRPDGAPADDVAVWGMSDAARQLAGGAADRWPDVDTVRDVNDKRFGHRVETELDVALPNAAVAHSVEEVTNRARRADRWIAKHPFGVSGRERVVGEGAPDEAVLRGLRRLFETTESVVWEPRVAIDREWSLHFDATDDGVRACGATELLTDRRGVFRGNVAPPDEPPSDALVEGATAAAEAVADHGYRGPIGIDTFFGTLNDREVWRPLVEINARMSFGRLALMLADHLDADRIAWHHPASAEPRDLPTPDEGDPRSGPYRLPDWCDPGGRSGSWFEILSDRFGAR